MDNQIEFLDEVNQKVFKQDYSSQTKIDGVKIVELNRFTSDAGDFSELIRVADNGEFESIPGFKLAQMNRTRLFSRSVKAWHVHQKQDEIWYVSPYFQLFVGLWDIRKGSPTANKSMRLSLGGGKSHMLFIPRGVAHGSANFSENQIELFYFVNQKFDINNPDEMRLHWDSLGAEFWTPERD